MSMSKFIKGQAIRCVDAGEQGTTVNESIANGEVYVVAEASGFGVRLAHGTRFWNEDRFVSAEHAEPEDETDAYVEPEPLKEGDAVLVWAKVVDPERDALGDFAIDVMYGATFDRTFARLDAIVRPDAGQVPPWVKPAQGTSLVRAVGGEYIRCELGSHPPGTLHSRVGGFSWTENDKGVGRITEGGAS